MLNSQQISEFSFSAVIGVKLVTFFNKDFARDVFKEFLRDFPEWISVATPCLFHVLTEEQQPGWIHFLVKLESAGLEIY